MAKLQIFVIAALFAAAIGWANLLPQGGSSPEACIRGFASAIERAEFEKAARFVENGAVSSSFRDLIKQSPLPKGFHLELANFSTSITGETAIVKFDVSMKSGGSPEKTADSVSLHRLKGAWYIVVPNSMDQAKMRSPISAIASLLTTNSPVFAQARTAAKKAQNLSNIKQLALATIMYCADYDDIFPKSVAGWHKAILPYCKNEALFKRPGFSGKGDSYALNPNVAGKSLNSSDRPDQVVLLYQGKNRKLDYSLGGVAAVAYMDGHCRLVSPDAAKKLRWKP